MLKKGDTVIFTKTGSHGKVLKIQGKIKEIVRENYGKCDVIVSKGAKTLEDTLTRVNQVY